VFDSKLSKKIDDFVKEKFPLIYEYNFDGILLLYGGVIRNLIMDLPVKDLDFIILTQEKCQIIDFVKKYRLKYTINAGGGYKISYNDFGVDISSYNDLLDAAVYDADLIFYDVHNHMFISCGAIESFNKRVITEVNTDKEPIYSDKFRIKKIIKFIKHITNNKKKVKVRQYKLLWKYKMFKKRIKLNLNKIIKGNLRKCLRFLRDCKKQFMVLILLSFFVTLISVIMPILLGKIISMVTNIHDNAIYILVVCLVLLRCFSIIFSYYVTKLYFIVRKKMMFNIRRDTAKAVLDLRLENFVNNDSGMFIEKLKTDPLEISRAFNRIKNICMNFFGNILIVFYIYYLDYRIGLVLTFFIIIIFNIEMIGVRKRRKRRMTYFYDHERCTSVLGEMISGMSDIKKLNLSNGLSQNVESKISSSFENQFKGDDERVFYNKLANLMYYVAMALILALGLYLTYIGSMEVSSLIIICMYNTSLFAFLNKFGMLADAFSDLNISCSRVFSLLDDNLYIKQVFGQIYKDTCDGIIEFDNVTFKYMVADKNVLDKCKFKVNSGETILLVGESGSGKTTIFNLISRLFNVNDGTIKIDNIDINNYSERFIRENVSIVSQQPYLFDVSIKDNLRLVKEDITDSEIKDVCKMVCLDKFIETLPKKYDTVVGEGGSKLSGGQKQRLGIARALIKNTKIILLDEITSSLDNETSIVLKKVVMELCKNHTVIIITHDVSMFKDIGRVLVLDDGKIVGSGVHNDLIQNSDVYKKICTMK